MQLLPVTEMLRGLAQELAPALEEQTEKPRALAQARALPPLKVTGMLKAQALAPERALVAPEVRLQGLALAQVLPQVRVTDQLKDLELAPEQEQEELVEWPLAQALAQAQLPLKAAALLKARVQELELAQEEQVCTRLALVQARDLLLLKVTGMLKGLVPVLALAQVVPEARQLVLEAAQARHHHMAVARLKDRALELERELAALVDTRLAPAVVLDLLLLKVVVPPKDLELALAPGQEELEVTLPALEVAQVQHNLKVAAQRKGRVLAQVLAQAEAEAPWRLALAPGLLPLKAMAQAQAQEPVQALAPVAPEA